MTSYPEGIYVNIHNYDNKNNRNIHNNVIIKTIEIYIMMIIKQ